MQTYLVRAPVPGGQYGETQSHARPGQVPGDCVPEQVHGVLPGQVAGAVGNDLAGHGHAVHVLQVAKATNLVESCGCVRNVGNESTKQTSCVTVFFLSHANQPVMVRMMAPTIMTNVCRVSV